MLNNSFLKCMPILAAMAMGSISTTARSSEDGPENSDISRGARAWSENCQRCHHQRDPAELPPDLWKPIVYHMRVRAGLTGQDTRDILKFLQEIN